MHTKLPAISSRVMIVGLLRHSKAKKGVKRPTVKPLLCVPLRSLRLEFRGSRKANRKERKEGSFSVSNFPPSSVLGRSTKFHEITPGDFVFFSVISWIVCWPQPGHSSKEDRSADLSISFLSSPSTVHGRSGKSVISACLLLLIQ